MLAALFGAVAQLAERLLCKEKVRSSNLLGSTAPDPAYYWKSAGVVTAWRAARVQPAPNDRAFEPVHVVVSCPDSSER
jgi:hypothetical protein